MPTIPKDETNSAVNASGFRRVKNQNNEVSGSSQRRREPRNGIPDTHDIVVKGSFDFRGLEDFFRGDDDE